MSSVSATDLAKTKRTGKSVDGQSVSSGAFHDLYVSMPQTPRLTAGRWFAVREIVIIVATHNAVRAVLRIQSFPVIISGRPRSGRRGR